MNLRPRRVLATFATLSVIFAACTPAAAPAPVSPAGPAPAATAAGPVKDTNQSINIAVRQIPANPTPAISNGDQHIYWGMFDKITEMEGNFVIKPSIAEKWEVSADGKAWRFTIRNDMKWPDGEKLTADDVAYTINLIRDRKFPQLSYLGAVTDAKVIDERTFDLILKAADGSIPAATTMVFVFPKKYIDQVGLDAFYTKPVGSGPYELAEFKTNEVIRLKKRATAHAYRKPEATELVFKQIPENSATSAGLQTGDIDLAIDPNFTAEQVEKLKSAGISITPRLTAVISLNMPQGSYDGRNTPFKSDKVRQAVTYAINRDVIANKLFGGYAKAAYEMAVPGSLYANPAVQAIPYDPAKAKQLLTEAGYPNGFTVATGMEWTTGFTNQEVMLALQSDLKAVGIIAAPSVQEQSVIVDKAFGRNNLTLADMTTGRNPDVIGLGQSRTFTGCNKPAGGPATSLVWCNPEWDKIMDQAYVEGDPAKQTALLRAASKLQSESFVFAPLYFEPAFTVYTKKLTDVKFQHINFFKLDALYKVK